MKKLLLLFILCLSIGWGNAANKYYLAATGSDTNTGTNTGAPWQTITKLNTVTFVAGDSVFFRSGDTFMGTIVVNQSGTSANNIVFTSYGSGAKPIISGALPVNSWTLSGPATYGTIYKATFTQTPTQFFKNNKEMDLARFPNNHQYLTLNSATTTTLYDASLASVGSATINNSKICIHTRQWCWEKTGVSSVTGNTVTFTNALTQSSLPNYGYFFYDNLAHLDTVNEWKYDGATQKLNYIVPTGQTPSTLTCEASVNTYSNGLEFGSLTKYITIKNLAFEKQANSGILINSNNNQYIKIDNCSFARQYNYGVNDKGRYNEISNCYFREIDGLVVYLNGTGRKCNVHHNTFRNNGQIRNSGIGLQYNCTSIHNSSSDSCYIHHNDIDSAGYCGISVDAAHNTIERNVIKNAMMCNNDGAAIKSWFYGAFDNTFQNNFIIDCNGVTEGTSSPDFLTPGIYFDFNVSSCFIKNNTIYNHSGRGIFQNAGNHHNTITGNVVYGTDYGIELNGTTAQTMAINNMVIKRNSVFALNNTAYLLRQVDGAGSNMFNQGYIDSNYLFQPYNPNKIAIRMYTTTPVSYSFAAWQVTGNDLASKKSFVSWIMPTNNSTLTTNMTDNVVNIPLSGLYLDLDSNLVCSSINLQPYTSKILINAFQTCASGFKENTLENNLLMYPNPTQNYFYIVSKNNDIQIKKIIIMDITGKIIKTEEVNFNQIQLNLGDLVDGMYLVNVTDNNGKIRSQKLIINK